MLVPRCDGKLLLAANMVELHDLLRIGLLAVVARSILLLKDHCAYGSYAIRIHRPLNSRRIDLRIMR